MLSSSSWFQTIMATIPAQATLRVDFIAPNYWLRIIQLWYELFNWKFYRLGLQVSNNSLLEYKS